MGHRHGKHKADVTTGVDTDKKQDEEKTGSEADSDTASTSRNKFNSRKKKKAKKKKKFFTSPRSSSVDVLNEDRPEPEFEDTNNNSTSIACDPTPATATTDLCQETRLNNESSQETKASADSVNTPTVTSDRQSTSKEKTNERDKRTQRSRSVDALNEDDTWGSRPLSAKSKDDCQHCRLGWTQMVNRTPDEIAAVIKALGNTDRPPIVFINNYTYSCHNAHHTIGSNATLDGGVNIGNDGTLTHGRESRLGSMNKLDVEVDENECEVSTAKSE